MHFKADLRISSLNEMLQESYEPGLERSGLTADSGHKKVSDCLECIFQTLIGVIV